jgi:WD40 repeat protein
MKELNKFIILEEEGGLIQFSYEYVKVEKDDSPKWEITNQEELNLDRVYEFCKNINYNILPVSEYDDNSIIYYSSHNKSANCKNCKISNEILLIDCNSPMKIKFTLQGDEKELDSVFYAPKYNLTTKDTLISVSQDCVVRVWSLSSLSSQECIKVYKNEMLKSVKRVFYLDDVRSDTLFIVGRDDIRGLVMLKEDAKFSFKEISLEKEEEFLEKEKVTDDQDKEKEKDKDLDKVKIKDEIIRYHVTSKNQEKEGSFKIFTVNSDYLIKEVTYKLAE